MLKRPFPYIRTRSDDEVEHTNRPSTQMAVALGRVKASGEVYGGTVFGAEKAKRRKRGKAQRAGRRIARKARRS